MKGNTPPRHNVSESHDGYDDDFNEDDDELVYVGTAEEVFGNIENEMENGSDDDDDNDAENELALAGSSTVDGANNENDDDDEAGYVPQRDDALITFDKHTGPVFCGCLHPTEDLAATGGEDDKSYVWETDTGNVVFEVNGHTDSVTAVEFSYDGNYLATGDMAGNIQIFKVHQQYKKCTEFQMGDMVWMKWHHAANVLLAGSDTGEVYIWRVPSGDCKVLQGNGHKSEAGELMADGKRIVIGYGDGTVKLWDIKNSQCVQEINRQSPLGHTGAITCLATDSDNNIFLSGSIDEKIVISSVAGPLHNLEPNSGSIEALACSMDNDLKLLACGTLFGRVTLWDIAKQAIRMECKDPNDSSGITRIMWAPNCTLLCATLSGLVKGFDGRSGILKFTLDGHRAEIYELNYNKSKNLLLTVSEDKTAKIFIPNLL